MRFIKEMSMSGKGNFTSLNRDCAASGFLSFPGLTGESSVVVRKSLDTPVKPEYDGKGRPDKEGGLNRKLKFTLNLMFVICNLNCFSAILHAQPERVLDLKESVASGLSNNQQLLALKEQITLAQQRVNEARALRYPRIDFNMSASQAENDFALVLSPSFESVYLPQGIGQHYSTRFTLWQYLYAAGKYTNNLRLAETNLSEAQGQAEIVKNKLIMEIHVSFFSLVAARDRVKAYEAALSEISAVPDRIKWAEVESRLKFDLAREKHRYEKAQLKFLSVIGSELDTEIEVSGQLEAPEESYGLPKLLAWAFQYRPELRQTLFQEAIDSLRVNLSMAERFPTVTMGAMYEWQGDRFPLEKKNLAATINLNVPIFDGWATWSRIKQRRLAAREGKIRRASIEDNIRYEVRDAYLDYNFWLEQIKLRKSLKSNFPGEPDKKLENVVTFIDTLEQANESHAGLKWAVGNYLREALQGALPKQ